MLSLQTKCVNQIVIMYLNKQINDSYINLIPNGLNLRDTIKQKIKFFKTPHFKQDYCDIILKTTNKIIQEGELTYYQIKEEENYDKDENYDDDDEVEEDDYDEDENYDDYDEDENYDDEVEKDDYDEDDYENYDDDEYEEEENYKYSVTKKLYKNFGIINYKNGNIYKGEMVNYKPHGHGIIWTSGYDNGIKKYIYEGTFYDGSAYRQYGSVIFACKEYNELYSCKYTHHIFDLHLTWSNKLPYIYKYTFQDKCDKVNLNDYDVATYI